MPSALSHTEAILALSEIKSTFKNLSDDQWVDLQSIIWTLLLSEFIDPWVKAKLYALPDTGEYWKLRLKTKEA